MFQAVSMSHCVRITSTLVSVMVLMGVSAANAVQYRMIDTGLSLGRGGYVVTAINNRGDVAAIVDDNGVNRVVVRQVDGNLIDYGVCADHANLSTINNSGTVGGNLGWQSYRPGVRERGQSPVDLGAIIDPYGGGDAWAINECGQVVGSFGDRGACMWQKDNSGEWYVTVLANTIPAWGLDAFDINDNGYVVGYVNPISDSLYVPVIWRDAGSSEVLFEGAYGQARAINNQNIVLCRRYSNDYFLWDYDHGQPISLPMAEWRSLNDRNQLVGYSAEGHPLFWDDGDTSVLPLSDEWTAAMPFGINNNGWIVGTAATENGEEEMSGRIVIWQPVPEPSSILSLLFGLSGFGGFLLKTRRR